MSDKITTFSMKSEVMSNKDFSQDDRFMHVKLSLCTHNQKANGVHFSRELLESKMSEIDFMPIVGKINIVEKEDGTVKYCLGSHEVEMDIVDNELVFKKNTIVLGVALPNTAKFETITRHDDSTEYITFDALLFQEKYPQLKSVINMETDASMELDKMDCEYNEDNGWYEVKDFRFLAHCLIGVPPAFKLAGVVNQFSMEDFKLEFSDMLEEIKSSLDKFNENEEKGGNDMEETTIEVVEEVEGIDVDMEETEADTEVKTEDTAEDVETQVMGEIVEDSPIDEVEETIETEAEEIVDYQEKFVQLEGVYNELEIKYTELQEEFDRINTEYQAKLQQEEFAKKQDIIASYSDSLTEEEINGVITDINVFSVEDVDVKLAAFLGKKIKSEKATQKEQQVFANIQPDFSADSKWASWLKKMN